jgi:ABC-type branched-subunit amino acid transport system ATPase component
METMNLLETEDLGINFGSLAAVQDVNFSIKRGELKSIIGPNGAGKTTFFNLLTGVHPPSKGRIRFKGEDISGLSSHQRARKGIGRSFQITAVFPQLTAYENVLIPAMHYHKGSKARDRAMEILEEVGLEDKTRVVAGNLSHGDQRHLDIAIALTCQAELLLLDEPTSGMPPEESMHTLELIRKLKNEKNYTIILIEHKMDIVLKVSDAITVLYFGRKLAEGTPTEIQQNEEVQKAYLGGMEKGFSLSQGKNKRSAPTGKAEILRLEKINTYYGESHILQDVSLVIKEGEIVSLLGRNGAGKTTTLRSILGLTPPRNGKITFKGEIINEKSPNKIVKSGLSLVPAERRIFQNLTVHENLELPFFLKGIPVLERRRQLDQAYEYFPELKDRVKHKGNRLSGGEQQMLAVARALMGKVNCMLLDEPSQGLAPLIVRHVAEIILEINKAGVTILLVEQNALMALALADRVYVIDQGQIVYEGTPEVLLANHELSQRLLGV